MKSAGAVIITAPANDFFRSLWVTASCSGLDVADVLNAAADLLAKHALQLDQAGRPVTSECAVVFAALMNGNDCEPVTEFSVAYPLDRLEHAQVARGEHASR